MVILKPNAGRLNTGYNLTVNISSIAIDLKSPSSEAEPPQ
jgi:hypothetical protein